MINKKYTSIDLYLNDNWEKNHNLLEEINMCLL